MTGAEARAVDPARPVRCGNLPARHHLGGRPAGATLIRGASGDSGHPDSGHPDSGHPDSGHPDSGQPSPATLIRATLRRATTTRSAARLATGRTGSEATGRLAHRRPGPIGAGGAAVPVDAATAPAGRAVARSSTVAGSAVPPGVLAAHRAVPACGLPRRRPRPGSRARDRSHARHPAELRTVRRRRPSRRNRRSARSHRASGRPARAIGPVPPGTGPELPGIGPAPPGIGPVPPGVRPGESPSEPGRPTGPGAGLCGGARQSARNRSRPRVGSPGDVGREAGAVGRPRPATPGSPRPAPSRRAYRPENPMPDHPAARARKPEPRPPGCPGGKPEAGPPGCPGGKPGSAGPSGDPGATPEAGLPGYLGGASAAALPGAPAADRPAARVRCRKPGSARPARTFHLAAALPGLAGAWRGRADSGTATNAPAVWSGRTAPVRDPPRAIPALAATRHRSGGCPGAQRHDRPVTRPRPGRRAGRHLTRRNLDRVACGRG